MIPDSSRQALTRRQFMKTASVTGATAVGGVLIQQASAAAGPGETPPPVKTVGQVPSKQEPPDPPAPPDRQPPGLVLPEVVERKIGWAVVGIGQLALEEILPAFAQCKFSKLVALVSGHPDKASQVAKAYGVAPANILTYEDYPKLAEMPEVDAVYIVLPNSLHAEYTILASKAGKHVLCEKPLAASVDECTAMINAAEKAGRKLMTAYRLHYEPLNRKVMELCAEKSLGKIKLFTSSNCQNVQAPNIRLSAQLAGGPVGDVGVYSINAARYVLGEEPVSVRATAHQPKEDPRFEEVPESVAFTLNYPSGVTAHCVCSFGTAGSQRYEVIGDKGVAVMDPAFPYRGLKLTVRRPKGPDQAAEAAEINIPQINQFAAEMDHFSECILKDQTPRTTGEMGRQDVRIVAAIAEAVASGKTITL